MKNNPFHFIFLSILILAPGCKSPSGPQVQADSFINTARSKPQVIIKDSLIASRRCLCTDLSKHFNIDLSFQRIKHGNGYDSCFIHALILNKSSNIIDSIEFPAIYLFDTVFSNCLSCRSYSTWNNLSKGLIDGNYGDLIVADFDFDGRDDIAVIHDSGGIGGPTYNFYLQDSNQKFTLNKFLTDTVEFFPDKIDKQHKILKTSVIISYCDISEMNYLYSQANKSWRRINHDIIHMGKRKPAND